MDFSVIIARLRDFFVITGELAKAELCNKMLAQLDTEKKYIHSLTYDEAKDLLRYFVEEAGYISYESSPGIHKIINEISAKIYGETKFKPLRKKEKEKVS
jgi:hypothetical protein